MQTFYEGSFNPILLTIEQDFMEENYDSVLLNTRIAFRDSTIKNSQLLFEYYLKSKLNLDYKMIDIAYFNVLGYESRRQVLDELISDLLKEFAVDKVEVLLASFPHLYEKVENDFIRSVCEIEKGNIKKAMQQIFAYQYNGKLKSITSSYLEFYEMLTEKSLLDSLILHESSLEEISINDTSYLQDVFFSMQEGFQKEITKDYLFIRNLYNAKSSSNDGNNFVSSLKRVQYKSNMKIWQYRYYHTKETGNFIQRLAKIAILADIYYEKGEYQKAKENYVRVVGLILDDRLQYRYENAKFKSGNYANRIAFVKSFIQNFPDNHYKYSLVYPLFIKWNQEQKIRRIANFEIDLTDNYAAGEKDYIIFLKAEKNLELLQFNQAIELYFLLLDRPYFAEKSFSRIKKILNENINQNIINKISNQLSDNPQVNYFNQLLLEIAKSFEKLDQLQEANFIYEQILADSTFNPRNDVQISIIKNQILTEDYQSAIHNLQSIDLSAQNSERKADLLFLRYQATNQIDVEIAKQILLKLHFEFPNYNRKTVLFDLYNFYRDSQPDFSLYFLKLLAKDYKYIADIEIKKEIDNLSRILNQHKSMNEIKELIIKDFKGEE